MIRVLVISYEVEESVSRASRLHAMGFEAIAYPTTGPRACRGIRQEPPHVILIDLVPAGAA